MCSIDSGETVKVDGTSLPQGQKAVLHPGGKLGWRCRVPGAQLTHRSMI
jgi:hypothetical protein